MFGCDLPVHQRTPHTTQDVVGAVLGGVQTIAVTGEPGSGESIVSIVVDGVIEARI